MSQSKFVKGQVFQGPEYVFVIHYVVDQDRIVVRHRNRTWVDWVENTMSTLELYITLADHEAKEISL